MRKIFLFLFFLASTFLLKAQDIDLATAKALVSKNIAATGLTASDLDNSIITNAYNSGELQLVYVQQAYKGLPVYNVIKTLAFKGGKLISNAGDRIPEIGSKVNQVAGTPSVSAEDAVKAALSLKKLPAPLQLTKSTLLEGRKYDFGKLGLAYENVTAELLWVPIQDGKQVKLAWQVYLVPKTSSDYWMIRMDASNNRMLEENNLTVYCNWDDPAKRNVGGQKYKGILAYNGNAHAAKPDSKSLFDVTSLKATDADHVHESPTIVNSASYRVIALPAESPKHPGGTPVLINDPWNAAPGNATSLKWHSNGTTDYNITRGNNVWAKEDHAANNGSGGAPATSTTPADPLAFNFVPDFFKQPNQTAPVPNQQFNITNLFYWINTYHDIMYQYGFDEPAGNFQANNQGRGGAGNDFVFGDAQDGNYVAPNQDNANFSTPADGNSGRMQMYLWDTVATFLVNSPSPVAGNYTSVEGGFSTANKLINIGPVTGQVVYYNDNVAGTTHEACGVPANSVAGKIALIDRGNCNFTVKVKNAQTAGAIAVIMVNNVAGYVLMGGSDNTITIPAVNISQADGAILAAQLANNLNVTLAAANLDGDVDNGVIVHEHSHGISNRLTGGPAQAGCVSNAEHMGEGWSDYYSLMLTQDWANSNLNTGFSSPRGIGSYVIGQGPAGAGIRTKKYCTDFTVNNLVYATSIPTVPHDRGEIWCATLWDMTWNIINQVGTINPSIYNATGGGGNTIALKLVTEGMKLQPCSPGFIAGRDAILAADQSLYGGLYSCAIKEAFRRRGMGQNASQGSANNVTDQVTDFAVIASCNCTNVVATTQPVNTSACTGANATFTVAAGGTTPTYQWQVSTNGGTSYSNISGATAATLTLNAVTSGMNNNLYQVVITNSCPSTVTSTAALLTVTDPASITTQPTNAAVCAGSNTSFTVAAAGTSNTYQWQVSTDGGATFNNVPGATTATLTLNAVTAALNGNQYHLVITSCGPGALTSNNVTLTVNSPASISTQPTNTNACTGTNTSFSVTAAGTGVSYQWQVSTNGGTSYSTITGATSSTLDLTAVTSGMNNNLYQVIVSSSTCAATVTSSAATLSISDPASISAQPAGVTVCAGSNAS
ncbi:MAG TPA: M36 family metallopeptidase, partial [Ferruginibacter sp.]|nr:M36 family metallopeptidase [Ferruginibacter sp.]